ncbi:MAG: hypothetical protein ABSB19_13115 [Methylomonas sp.]|jgi:hypothetical protein
MNKLLIKRQSQEFSDEITVNADNGQIARELDMEGNTNNVYDQSRVSFAYLKDEFKESS